MSANVETELDLASRHFGDGKKVLDGSLTVLWMPNHCKSLLFSLPPTPSPPTGTLPPLNKPFHGASNELTGEDLQ